MNTNAAQTGEVAPGTIVVGVADHPSEPALDWAVTEATMTGHPITLVHALTPIDTQQRVSLRRMGVSPEALMHDELVEAHAHLEELAQKLERRGVTVHAVVTEGDAAEVLTALSGAAYRVVVGSRGRGTMTSRLLGSVGSTLVRHADCPAVVVRPTHGAHLKHRIVATASSSAEGQTALETAFLEAEGRHCALTLVAHDPRGIPASGQWALASDQRRLEDTRLGLAESVAGLQEDHPDVAVATCVADGSLLHALLDLGRNAQSIVIERPGQDGRRGVFGVSSSLAASVVEHAATTVMVVP